MASDQQAASVSGVAGLWAGWQARRRRRRERRETAHALYGRIVAEARRPRFYRAWAVPDTANGRFEMIVLHAAPVMRRLRDGGETGQALAQDVFDVMFGDVDRSLREQGVGDLSVGKHVKRAASTFLARCHALDPALATGDVDAVKTILARNAYAGVSAPEESAIHALAEHVMGFARRLEATPLEDVIAGAWPEGDAAAGPPHRAPSAAGETTQDH